MKNIAKSLVIAGALALTGVASAAITEDFGPYVGVDYKHNWMKAKDKEFQGFAPKSYPGASVYVGGKFNENFGAELGYDFTKKKSKQSSITVTNTLTGVSYTGDVKSKVRFSGPRLDLNAYLPMDNCFELLGSVGVGFLKPRISVENVSLNATAFNYIFDADETNLKGKNKLVARLGAGAQYLASENVGVRGLVRWENTSKLRLKDSNDKLFKDNISLNLGVFYKF